jgi:hypothetical protein
VDRSCLTKKTTKPNQVITPKARNVLAWRPEISKEARPTDVVLTPSNPGRIAQHGLLMIVAIAWALETRGAI